MACVPLCLLFLGDLPGARLIIGGGSRKRFGVLHGYAGCVLCDCTTYGFTLACIGVAARHTTASRCLFKIGRRASSTAFRRWSVRNDNPTTTIVRRSASACLSGRSASSPATQSPHKANPRNSLQWSGARPLSRRNSPVRSAGCAG
ncbi:DUF1534 domain-containing protein [Pseudomonas syringae pv. tomato]|nr:DUF1534 domain-containing protein [Pseudomonas syringae]TES67713.1 DUF1534 domain-containing protein [Pseudomonas syringae pv. tomato]